VIATREVRPGVIEVSIPAAQYGQAGAHWRKVLTGPNHNGYGKLYIQRLGANQRRYWHCYGPRDWYRGEAGVNQDECPGAMFIWTSHKQAHVEAVDAIDNQKLGRDLGQALRRYEQRDEKDLWAIVFRFV
jgi:hypothetical protein